MKGYPGVNGHRRIVLQPAELHFEWHESNLVVHTLLGSCVALTFWHPRLKVGGMCHFLLPNRDNYVKNGHHPIGYYGSDAINFFIEQIESAGHKPSDFQVKMFGGSHVIRLQDKYHPELNVADANICYGRTQIVKSGFSIKAEDVGGRRYRKIVFELATGNVWVQYGKAN
ncbi:chemotaxis protein CheD [Shewanella avicenniae]|uniref:Probable chemoreceptor glutamine deamidase CheD n=1 Tax=Shewanella avicenniae TaxID=2814294 RepID=A0ABX7QQD6_9GAMM|nr:chemotaxis protein CheD [Shewanella avicenniae]QSX33190.1 chemotaxis protein CheD [Shewanella avicenniae]